MVNEREREVVKIRWGDAVTSGFQPVPHLLFKCQTQLDLTNSEMVVLLNILDFWWQADSLPFPGVSMLAKRMGVSSRSVQRAVESLERKHFVKRASALSPSGQARKGFDVSGLVLRLQEMAKTDVTKKLESNQQQKSPQDGGLLGSA
ncbi:helix-turn-helix domain-containing protein (plasmid) [Paraburkholderia sp. FT54]|uniref:helix-turn-helix domain-containing protein n=1 Tax=Paraburkholderia sp. FT54 TaxID=3074437 RepID=UPI0028778B81|nr:helix-turn-helix domain-containing protein [Paraburkholderia sp. FT54]WNC95573.1 helix-turn-helix domain-containing protein [Paraburkholderia sp. FT54]